MVRASGGHGSGGVVREPEWVPWCSVGVHWSESGRGHRCGGVVGGPVGKPGCVWGVYWSEGGLGRVGLWPGPDDLVRLARQAVPHNTGEKV